MAWSAVEATLAPGYRVASGGSAKDRRFNALGGTIRMQIAPFRARGFDLEAFFGGQADRAFVCGTLGLNIAPRRAAILKPEIRLEAVRWTDLFDRPGEKPFVENFFLSPAEILYAGRSYKALIYIPDPATKPDHFHPPSLVECIAAPIEGIDYGDRLTLHFDDAALAVG